MLYLAQAQKNPTSGEMELQLLAYQQSDRIWEVSKSEILHFHGEAALSDRLLVLIDVGDNQQISNIREAKDWIINLLQQHFTKDSLTPEFIQEEQARVEQWRQEITAQSLDLTRRQLEIETHRDQLQELEANLKQEKQQFEIHQQQLQEREDPLK
jgi:hypothetical protein